MENDSNFTDFFDNLPGLVFCKNEFFKFRECNLEFASAAGFHSSCRLNDCTDYDMPWFKYAEKYRNDDLSILKQYVNEINREEQFVDSHGKEKIVHVVKRPIYAKNDPNKVVGIVGSSRILFSEDDRKDIAKCDPMDIKAIQKLIHKKITIRQAQCLYYLLEGLAYSEIAIRLNVGERVIQDHFENLRWNFNAKNKKDLFKIAQKIGFSYIRPEGCD